MTTSHARTFAPDPHCVICDGLGVRHGKPKRVGMHVRRDPCPCTILGPLTMSAARATSEIPPIEDTAVLDQYPDCQPRTPIDPPTTIKGLVYKGNTDINPSTWNPPVYRDCDRCEGKGVIGHQLRGGGHAACTKCHGHGKVKL